MPGLWARSPAQGMLEAPDPCISRTLMFLPPFPSLLKKKVLYGPYKDALLTLNIVNYPSVPLKSL